MNNSATFVNPANWNMRQLLFNCWYGLICVSAILGGEYTGAFAAVAYFQFLFISRGYERDGIAKICLYGFIASIVASILIAAIHIGAFSDGLGQPRNTVLSLIWFAAAFMIVEAVRFQVAYYKINVHQFARWLLVFSLAAIVFRIAHIGIVEDLPLSSLLTASDRTTPLIKMNSNHSDDVAALFVFMFLWCLAVLWERKRGNLPFLAAGAVAAIFMLHLFFGINSRAGFVGIAASVILVLAIVSLQLSWIRIAVLAACVAASIFLLPQSLTERFFNAGGQLANIASLFGQYSNVQHENTSEREALRDQLLSILNNPSQGSNIKTHVANACSGNVDEALDEALQIDPATGHRFLLLIDGWRILTEKPVFGHGGYAKQEFLKNNYNVDYCNIAYFSHIHNNYLDIAIRGGLFSLLLFATLSAVLFYLIRLSFLTTGKHWMQALPIMAYFPYLYVESLFGMTFNRYAELIAVQISMLVLLSINLKYPYRQKIDCND